MNTKNWYLSQAGAVVLPAPIWLVYLKISR